MAAFTTNYIGLTRIRATLGVESTTATFSNYIAAIAAAEGLSSSYYFISLARDPNINITNYPTETFAAMGIVADDTLIAALVSDTGLTKEQKQNRKLAIASAARAQDSRRAALDITQLPNPYNGDDVNPDENPNTGGLVEGRPWLPYTAGLLRGYYVDLRPAAAPNYGYFADDVTWFDDTYRNANATNGIDQSPLNSPATGSRYSIQWRGYFKASTTETYTFYLNSDDASYMWLGVNAVTGYTTGNALVNNGGLHPAAEVSATVSLTAGQYYPIRIQYGNNLSTEVFALNYSTPTITKTTDVTDLIYYNANTSTGY